VVYILGCVIYLYWRQTTAHRDTLIKLAQVVAAQDIVQLWLAGKYNLNQLVSSGLKIGNQAHLFQYIRLEILRLIDNKYNRPSGAVLFDQKTVVPPGTLSGSSPQPQHRTPGKYLTIAARPTGTD